MIRPPARLSVFLLGVVCLVACPHPDAAAAEEIETGRTSVTLAKTFDAELKAEGVGIQTIKSRVAVRVVTWPIFYGHLDPDGRGYLRYHAAIRFHSGSRRVLLRRLALDTRRKRKILRGFFDDHFVAIASADVESLRRQGSDFTFVSHLRLTPKMASILNRRLVFHRRLQPGELIGRAVTLAQPTPTAAAAGFGVPVA